MQHTAWSEVLPSLFSIRLLYLYIHYWTPWEMWLCDWGHKKVEMSQATHILISYSFRKTLDWALIVRLNWHWHINSFGSPHCISLPFRAKSLSVMTYEIPIKGSKCDASMTIHPLIMSHGNRTYTLPPPPPPPPHTHTQFNPSYIHLPWMCDDMQLIASFAPS